MNFYALSILSFPVVAFYIAEIPTRSGKIVDYRYFSEKVLKSFSNVEHSIINHISFIIRPNYNYTFALILTIGVIYYKLH